MSVPFRVEQACTWTGATRLRGCAERSFDAVSIDTRTLSDGALFVAISGENHDAHDFLDRAVAAGASGLMIEAGRLLPTELPEDLTVLGVDDTTTALGALARGHRGLFTGPLVAITGSNGKTSTKEMCAAILGVSGACHKNLGNLNNEFGLPLTLLAREPEHERVVVELGMNHRGEIARLAAITEPTVGVITNVGTAHIEFLGSQQEIAAEKGDLLAALGADAVAVSNGDDVLARAQLERGPARRLLFGFGEHCQVRAVGARPEGGVYHFELRTPEGFCDVAVSGLAETAVLNALAASAAALAAGIPLDEIKTGLARYRSVPGRLEPIARGSRGLVINDTYNANPQSLEVALRILARLSKDEGQGRRGIAVIGDMGELGDATEEAHRDAGRLAASLDIDRLYAVGSHAGLVAEGALAGGMPAARVESDESWETIGERVLAELRQDDQVLVKGSRAMRMERIVDLLTRSHEDRA
jgi:UDP-N-acetylmuramoyl-tripeptide--D-alanyl-D-alanine ligase